ncbi:topoisomerase [Bacillus sp. 3P20]|uniref:topoisomerase n=1 Tax=Bacillus sp. 3P20 TaxID=3079309 RepID=UPI0039B5AA1E
MDKTEVEQYFKDKKEVLQYYKDRKEEALKRASKILDKKVDWSSFNGIIGGKNDIYEVILENHSTVESYVVDWMYGHELAYSSDKHKKLSYNKYNRSSYKVHALLEDELLRKFIVCCLMKTYFNRKKTA